MKVPLSAAGIGTSVTFVQFHSKLGIFISGFWFLRSLGGFWMGFDPVAAPRERVAFNNSPSPSLQPAV